MNELALFSGAGGGILGGKLLGWRTVCAVEWELYPASVLCARQNDKILPTFPIWDDVQTFAGTSWRGIVDVVSGGFPCQDISAAGKGTGITGTRSSMWKHMARIIGEVQPKFVFVENSSMLTRRGLGTVIGDLASMGYDAEWGVISAADVGAKHLRKRIWIVAGQCDFLSHSNNGIKRWEQQSQGDGQKECNLANSNNGNRRGERRRIGSEENSQSKWNLCPIFNQPEPLRVVDGLAARVDRLKAVGNGQVPQVAALAWRVLSERLKT